MSAKVLCERGLQLGECSCLKIGDACRARNTPAGIEGCC